MSEMSFDLIIPSMPTVFSPPIFLAANRVVQVWRIALDRSDAEMHQLTDWLSKEEQTRAKQFYFEKDRRRFMVAHAIARVILAGYLNVPAKELVFAANPYGKPFLQHPQSNPMLEFNLAHSNALAVLAVTAGRSVGVDIEYMRSLSAEPEVVRTAFTASETFAIESFPKEKRLAAFFAGWTRKEAYIKATGLGLAQLNQFTVNVEPEAAFFEPLDISGAPLEKSWLIRALNALSPYVGAVAAEGADWEIEEMNEI